MDAIAGGLGRPFERLSDRIGGAAILGQNFVVPRTAAYGGDYTETVPVPEGATFVFAELLCCGNAGSTSASRFYSGGGGGGSDAIVPLASSSSISVFLPSPPVANDVTATVSINGAVAVSTTSGISASASSSRIGAAGSGKYPGTPGSSGNTAMTGRGGGRLSGKPTPTDFRTRPTGPGCGGAPTSENGTYQGGEGQAMLTFFSDYDSALAFAKSVYGGSWTP